MGLKPGDKILEWDGKSLVNLSYEQTVSTRAFCDIATSLCVLFATVCHYRFVEQDRRVNHRAAEQRVSVGARACGRSSVSNTRIDLRLCRERKSYLYHQKRRLSQASTQQSFDFNAPGGTTTTTAGISPIARRKLPQTPDHAPQSPVLVPQSPVPLPIVMPPFVTSGAVLCQFALDVERQELRLVVHTAQPAIAATGYACFAQAQVLGM